MMKRSMAKSEKIVKDLRKNKAKKSNQAVAVA